MKPIGPIGTPQDLNLRDGDFVICVCAKTATFSKGKVYPITISPVTGLPAVERPDGECHTKTRAEFQRLHHHDPRCFGFEEKTTNQVMAGAYRERLRKVAGFSNVPEPIPMNISYRSSGLNFLISILLSTIST